MTQDALSHEWIAGFFDGEGSITITRNRAGGRSDYHKMIVTLVQRVERADRVYAVQHEFGGRTLIRSTRTRSGEQWGDAVVWQLQDKAGQRRFLEAIRPHVGGKRRQVEIALRFLDQFSPATVLSRDNLGRLGGWTLTEDVIRAREALRLEMQEANRLGPRTEPYVRPDIEVRHRPAPTDVPEGDRATIRRGEQMHNALVTEAIVLAIRERYAAENIRMRDLGAEYGLTRVAVWKIIHGETWAHVGGPILSERLHVRHGNSC
jgi:hypothetical protein